jgi:Na+-translocating ferredoxin:NAD+ oxidoreductase RNF subunit RnfB
MHVSAEPVGDIAARAGLEPDVAQRTLERLADEELASAAEVENECVFGLMPGLWYSVEARWLPEVDEEIALLFERYYQETRGMAVHHGPSAQRVIPVGEAIPSGVEVYPYEQAAELLENARSWAVRPCICRLQQRAAGKGCAHEVGNCVVFAPAEDGFEGSDIDWPVTKEEALSILRESAEAGLVLTAGNYRDGNDFICSCCTCCCFMLRALAEFGAPAAVARSSFRAVVEAELCTGCGECVERCQLEALSLPEDVAVVDYGRCVGCGVCVVACPVEALQLERRPAGEVSLPPKDADEWRAQRAEARGRGAQIRGS